MDGMDRTESTREVVTRVYGHYAAGELEQAVAGLAADVDWSIQAPRHLFPAAGPRRGREEVLRVFRELRGSYEFLAYEPAMILADGDAACVYVRCVLRHAETGGGASLELCDVLKVRDGEIVWFREFVDAADAALALSGALADAHAA